MRDNRHIEEDQKLANCIQRINAIIAEDEKWLQKGKDEVGVFGEPAKKVREAKEDNIRNLREARPNPYFGRVDFSTDISPEIIDTYYFGKYHIPIDYVYSWTAPASKLFYQPQAGEYSSPSGKITGIVKLKRDLVIQQSKLIDLADSLLLPLGRERITREEMALTRELSKTKIEKISDIVATIQPEQYEQIAASLQQVLIVQGVVGSGKSQVGLHRIVYLLSPHNQLNLSIKPENVVFVGPSRQFLGYVSNILPGLWVEQVRQVTLKTWLKSTLSRRVRLEKGDSLFEKLIRSSGKAFEIEQRVASFKGSLLMARIINSYMNELYKDILKQVTDISYGENVVLNKARLGTVISEYRGTPLNEQRALVKERVKAELRKQSIIGMGKGLPAEVEEQFEKFWPELDYRDCYVRLLSDRERLLTKSKGSLTEQDVDFFILSPQKSTTFQKADLPALCYMDHALNNRVNIRVKGRTLPLFEHVVVDEAQDVTPLELLLLYYHSKNKSFTILGDIGQCLFPRNGINSWRDVKRVFSKESVQQYHARISYRATYEITRYTNRILKRIAPNLPKPIAYNRHGERLAFVQSKSYAHMVLAIAADIKAFKGQGMNTIAVLCKTAREALKMYSKLRNEGIEDVIVLDKSYPSRAGIVIASIFAAKGLEFDAVIIANARKNNFPGTDLHNRLLYSAVTRAAHRLHIHWFGAPAEILVTPELLSGLTMSKRRKGKTRTIKS